jgi:vacuolar-type H+-ATPase subunit I/STV1
MTKEARMMLREEYDAAVAAWKRAHSLLLSDRLTLSRKEAQMHEAQIEEAEDQIEYFADRRAQMQQQVAKREAQVESLAAYAEERRIAMVTQQLDATLASYEELRHEMVAALAALDEQTREAAALADQAEQLASTLPQSAARQHHAANGAAQRTHAIEAALRQLHAALVAETPPSA